MSNAGNYMTTGASLGSQASSYMASGNPAASTNTKELAGYQYAAASDEIQNNVAQLEVSKAARQQLTAGI